MRNVISRALAVTFLLSLTTACCKNRQPAATSAAATPAVTHERVASAETSAPANPPTEAPAARPETPRPATKEACAACQGKWGRHGLAEAESCLCRTKDGGRPCLDGAECEGQCVARDADFVVVQKGPPARGHYQGKCSEFDTTFGCHRFVPRGARKKGPLPAEDAADQLCYD
jgi:hypothetical protein